MDNEVLPSLPQREKTTRFPDQELVSLAHALLLQLDAVTVVESVRKSHFEKPWTRIYLLEPPLLPCSFSKRIDFLSQTYKKKLDNNCFVIRECSL